MTEKASETQQLASSTISYAYDSDGHLAALTYPDGHVVEYAYTARHQLAAVTAGGPPPVATYSYDLAGELTNRTLENGVSTGYAYDVAGQTTGIAQTLNNVAFDSLGYTLDNRGRRTGITRANGKNDGYTYDAIGEVVGAAFNATPTGSQTEGFSYDAAGNRVTSARNATNTSYTANANDQYTAVAGNAQTYDANGNNTLAQWSAGVPPVSTVSIAMMWDSENRMLSSESTTARSENGYDALHRRVTKKVYATNGMGGWNLAKTMVFTYDGWNVIAEKEYLGSASTPASILRYTWGSDVSGSLQGAGGVGGLLMAEEVNGAIAIPHYYAYDGNGNVTHVLDVSGNIESMHRYTAFGGELESVTTTTFAQRNPWRFSTKYLDREVETMEGFYYYGYRFYLTALGRWLSRDPIEEDGGINLYGMCGNDCVNWVDLLGMKWKKAAKDQQPKDEYRVLWQRDSDTDTLEELAKELGLDPSEKDKWAQKKGEGKDCPVSVPNIWIDANLMHGGGLMDRIKNLGGIFGRMFTFTGKKRIKIDHAKDLVGTIQKHKHDIIGFSMYAHGGPDGTIGMPDKLLKDQNGNQLYYTDGKPAYDLTRYTDQASVLAALDENGFKLAKAYVMQCYSGFKGTYNGTTYDWASEWSKRVFKSPMVYQGVNALGIDLKK